MIEQKMKEGERGRWREVETETQTDRIAIAWWRERAAERPFPSFARSILRQTVKLRHPQICKNPPLPLDDFLQINNNQQAEGVKASITEKHMAR